MKKTTLSLVTIVGCILSTLVNAASMGTAFTYQGRLNDGGAPANGHYDLEFKLFDGPVSPPAAQVGSIVALPDTLVSNGLFTVKLDFPGQFPGDARWLEIWANTNLAPVVKLTPRQELTPQPYAFFAAQSASAATAGSAASVPWSGVSGLTLGPGLVPTAGGFAVDASFGDEFYWKLLGNGGPTPVGKFLGTTDNQPLVIKTARSEAMRVNVGGNVGVGTATPADKLHVAGSAIFQGPSPWIDVRHYGAKGDGVTDDTGALLDALAAVPPSGAIVFAPPGTYMVSRPLGLEIKSGTVLKGAGTATLFKRVGGTTNLDNKAIFLSYGVNNVTAEDFAIDINGGGPYTFGIGFRSPEAGGAGCSNIRIRNLRIYDSVGVSETRNRVGILVQQSDHVWIERNYLSGGMMLKAGGIGDQLIVAENMVEDANDNAITIPNFGNNTKTVNYIIRNNVVKAARGTFIYIGDDGGGTNKAYQNIIVDGNLLLGPVLEGSAMVIVKMSLVTERLHIINNILANVGEKLSSTAGIETTIQTSDGLPGRDFLIANNSINGAFDNPGIWVQSVRGVRIANNQITYSGTNPPSHYAIWLGHGTVNNGVNEAVIQGNMARGCRAGLVIENSTKLQVIGNVFTDMAGNGIILSTTTNTDHVSAQIMGNTVCGTTKIYSVALGQYVYGQGISESGPPVYICFCKLSFFHPSSPLWGEAERRRA